MSFNGSGTFVINSAGQPVVSGTVISSTAFNALTADLANGLSTCITKDGQTTPTADIPMGSNKITGLANGTAAGDAANLGQVQSTVAKLLGSVSGADTITAVGSPTVAAYAAGQMFYFVAAGANTGAVTINIDSLGAKSITRDGTTALAAGDIQSGEVCVIVYDGTQFQLVNGASQSASIVTENLTVNKATVLNESGGDNDTRIEGDTDANLFFVDASTDRIGVGTDTPQAKLDVNGNVHARGASFPAFKFADASGTAEAEIYYGVSANDLNIVSNQSGGVINLQTGGGTKATLDSSGNLGLGVVPSAWVQYTGFQIGALGGMSLGGYPDFAMVAANAYNASGTYKYAATGYYSTLYRQTNGIHSWHSAANGTAGNNISFTQALTLNANGNLVLQGGSTGANGIGVTFPASQSASSDANCLDDYEEGTWTPVWEGTAGNPTVTYSIQNGRYTKIGDVVYVSFRIDVSTYSVGGGGGGLRLGGLPFTPDAAVLLPAVSVGYKASFSTNGPDYGRFNNSSKIELFADNNTGETAIGLTNVQANTSLIMSGFYYVA